MGSGLAGTCDVARGPNAQELRVFTIAADGHAEWRTSVRIRTCAVRGPPPLSGRGACERTIDRIDDFIQIVLAADQRRAETKCVVVAVKAPVGRSDQNALR